MESLDRCLVPFSGADAQRGIDRRDEDLAVADAARGGGGGDRLDHLLGLPVEQAIRIRTGECGVEAL